MIERTRARCLIGLLLAPAGLGAEMRAPEGAAGAGGGRRSGRVPLAPGTDTVPILPATRVADAHITIDGAMEEAAWREASPWPPGSRSSSPTRGEPATQRTEARVLYGAAALFVFMRGARHQRERDRRPAHAARPAVVFGSPGRGRRLVLRPAHGLPVRGQPRRGEAGRLPVRRHRRGRGGGTRSGTSRPRATKRDGAPNSASPTPSCASGTARNRPGASTSCAASRAGTSSRRGRPRPAPTAASCRASASSAGCGIWIRRGGWRFCPTRWPACGALPATRPTPSTEPRTSWLRPAPTSGTGVTSDITLDVTVNPDFGQVEADPANVNLTAFETFPSGAPAVLRRGRGHLQLRHRPGRRGRRRRIALLLAQNRARAPGTGGSAGRLRGRRRPDHHSGRLEALRKDGRRLVGRRAARDDRRGGAPTSLRARGDRFQEPVEPFSNHGVLRVQRGLRRRPFGGGLHRHRRTPGRRRGRGAGAQVGRPTRAASISGTASGATPGGSKATCSAPT